MSVENVLIPGQYSRYQKQQPQNNSEIGEGSSIGEANMTLDREKTSFDSSIGKGSFHSTESLSYK